MKGVRIMILAHKGIWLVCGAILLLSYIACYKSGRPLRAFFLTAISGTAGLSALYLLKQLCGVGLPINEMTLGVSAVAGIPGVILLLMTQLTMR